MFYFEKMFDLPTRPIKYQVQLKETPESWPIYLLFQLTCFIYPPFAIDDIQEVQDEVSRLELAKSVLCMIAASLMWILIFFVLRRRYLLTIVANMARIDFDDPVDQPQILDPEDALINAFRDVEPSDRIYHEMRNGSGDARNQMQNGTRNEPRNETPNEARNEPSDDLGNETSDASCDNSRIAIRDEVSDEVRNEVRDEISNEARNEVRDEIRDDELPSTSGLQRQYNDNSSDEYRNTTRTEIRDDDELPSTSGLQRANDMPNDDIKFCNESMLKIFDDIPSTSGLQSSKESRTCRVKPMLKEEPIRSQGQNFNAIVQNQINPNQRQEMNAFPPNIFSYAQLHDPNLLARNNNNNNNIQRQELNMMNRNPLIHVVDDDMSLPRRQINYRKRPLWRW
ncbi:hypothetical protein KR044_003866 [Drosophila immigrans]|nr:hypothetical protein KR044_003866 [Drosophila immigrans]